MTFKRISATPPCRREGKADACPPTGVSDPWAIFRALREAREHFGLRAAHLQTLQALISFLKPGQGEIVFASNNSICERGGGIDERTLRRHIARLAELGLITRHDSPNGKRFRVRSSEGLCLSFGFSLRPLFARAREILDLAVETAEKARKCHFLRKHILALLAEIDAVDSSGLHTKEYRKALRRRMTVTEYEGLLRDVEIVLSAMSTAVDAPSPELLPARNGQTDRHHQRSETERKDKPIRQAEAVPDLPELVLVCSEARSFTHREISDWVEAHAHAEALAPMIGIRPTTFREASGANGSKLTACAVFLILQTRERIVNPEAYFHSLTLGKRRPTFEPVSMVKKMQRALQPSASCPPRWTSA